MSDDQPSQQDRLDTLQDLLNKVRMGEDVTVIAVFSTPDNYGTVSVHGDEEVDWDTITLSALAERVNELSHDLNSRTARAAALYANELQKLKDMAEQLTEGSLDA